MCDALHSFTIFLERHLVIDALERLHDAIARPTQMELMKTEESVTVLYILDLDFRGFPPQLTAVEDMANHILDARHQAK